MQVPEIRIRQVGEGAVDPTGDLVLYWMTAFRRPAWNHALDRAIEHARALGRPLVVLEPLRVGYRWASDRIHRFVIDGMADNARAFEKAAPGVRYYPYVEPEAGAGKGLLAALARRACVVVTDDYPAFFHPRMLAAAGAQVPCRLEAVDANGLLPLRAADRVYVRAYDFRRFLQKTLLDHIEARPRILPLSRLDLPAAPALDEIRARWPEADAALLAGERSLRHLPIDHDVPPIAIRGGPEAGEARLAEFVAEKLAPYGDDRNAPQKDATSGLSPYLHFGHVSAHRVLDAIAKAEGWSPERAGSSCRGQREGWWGLPSSIEGFLDELVTWRELGLNMAWQDEELDQWHTLPGWARQTLGEHEADEREHVYDHATLERGETHDALWNAAQAQLREEGRIHNYLRMLWGKKVLEWSRTPREALQTLIELNNRWAIDGRDPNSYSGIFWCFGRYDRPRGPERPIFGKVRYMSSDNTARKVRVKDYIARYAPRVEQGELFAG